MMDTTLKFLAKVLDERLKKSFDLDGPSAVVGTHGNSDTEAQAADALVLTLLRASRDPESRLGRAEPLKLHFDVLLAARYPDNYELGLAALSTALAFFHANPVFTRSAYPGLPRGTDRLTVDLSPQSLNDMTSLWTVMGGKFLPSMVYRVGLVCLDDGTAAADVETVETVQINLSRL